MKLTFRDDFQLEIPLQNGDQDIIKGTVRELTVDEKDEIIKSTEDFTSKIERYQQLKKDGIETDELQGLEDFVKNQDFLLDTARKKFDLTIQSDKKDELKSIAEKYGIEGYQRVLETISLSVEELKEKK